MRNALRKTIAVLPWSIPLLCIAAHFVLYPVDYEARESWLWRISLIALLLPLVIPWMTKLGAPACVLAGMGIFILGGSYSGDMGDHDHYLTGGALAMSGILCGILGLLTDRIQKRLVWWWKT